jgi:3-oxoacyl-[acyl-carrier-protein] synthase III
MDNAEIGIEDIDKILMHQANAKMDHAMVSRFLNYTENQNMTKMFLL